MYTGAKEKVMAQSPKVEEKAKTELELVKVGAAKQGSCCDPDCGPSTCGG